MKIKFNSDDDLPLNKPMTIIIRSVFEEGGKLHPQIFLDDALYELYKNATIRKNDVSEGVDTNKTSASKERMLFHYWYFKDVGFKFVPHVCNKCHEMLITAYVLKNIAILNFKSIDFRCILLGISRD